MHPRPIAAHHQSTAHHRLAPPLGCCYGC
jgi:hypothetical protein